MPVNGSGVVHVFAGGGVVGGVGVVGVDGADTANG